MNSYDGVENRNHQRFIAREGAFATLWPSFKKNGEMIDISEGGLAFCYFTNTVFKNGSKEVDIFLQDHSFYLDSLPCRIVYEIASPVNPSSTTETKVRVGVQFKDIDPGHLSRLNYFIQNYTVRDD
ncbi:MAG: PilZ domain-containing protein [Pseudomonadota bacterium]